MKLRLLLTLAYLMFPLLPACGGDDDDDTAGDGDADSDADTDADTDSDADADTDTDTDADADADADTDADTDSDSDADTDADADADADGDCSAEIDALAARLAFPDNLACSVVVRLDHDSLAPLGYALVCGDYAGLDEDGARAVAQAATGYGASGERLSPENPEDTWVFYESPGDFGGAAAVSASTGLAVFGGSIVWDGAGELTYPAAWDDPRELGAACPASGELGTTRGYDLVEGGPLGDEAVQAAVDVVLDTAVPGALWRGGYAFSTVVLLYPRTVGGFDPSTAEWIVIVDGGWLE